MNTDTIDRTDIAWLLLNSALAAAVLIILTVALENAGLITYTVPSIIATTLLFFLIALSNLYIRANTARRLGYNYYYEHSLVYAVISFIVSARFYGFFPVLYLGGSRLTVDKLGRVGNDDLGTNHADLYRVASRPLPFNILVSLALIPITVTTQSSVITAVGLVTAAYTLFSTVPWPYSNGLHILSYNPRRWTFYALTALVLTAFYAIV